MDAFMKTGKRLLSLLLAAVLVFSLFGSALAADSKDIVILYTNDVHCAADDNIGYAGLAAYKAEMEQSSYVTLVDAGDALQGGVLGTLSKGSYIVDIMNNVGYDVAVPGNHEFDFGMDIFLSLAKAQKSGYVCCNFINLKTGKPVFDSYRMIKYGDKTVAYVGIDTPEAISKSTPTFFQDGSRSYIYGFAGGGNGQELYSVVQKAIDEAKAAGADYVVAVGHCGIDEQSAPWRSTDIIKNVTGLTAFIDGHSHSVIEEQKVADLKGANVLLASSGTKLAAIGKVTIKPDGTVSSELIKYYKVKDAQTAAFIGDIKSKNQALLDTKVARASVKLTTLNPNGTRAVRSRETNLGDLCADAYRVVGGADIGLVNGGGVRADMAAGDLTYGNIINVFPFNNSLCVVEATGQEILDALEMSARMCPTENGGFLQVSGLRFSIDTTIPSGVKLDANKIFVSVEGARRVSNVQVLNSASGNYEPISPTKTYTVASHDFMLKSGGDGINMFMNNKLVKDSVMLDNQVLIKYITESLKGAVPFTYASVSDRISIKYKASALFKDVADSAWYAPYVTGCYAKNIMSGTGTASFEPEAEMTRAMFITVLYRFNNSPVQEGKTSDAFRDCADKTWYSPAVLWAYRNGIAEGREDGTFAPDEPLNRQEMAAMLYRYIEFTGMGKHDILPINYEDTHAVSDWALRAVQYCSNYGIMNGVSETEFDPEGTATRAMGAAVLNRFAA